MENLEHIKLVNDITELLTSATDFQYHDFKNSIYPAPKLALVQKLEWLIKNVKSGKYDN